MAWRVEFLTSARREFEKLSPDIQVRIRDFLYDRIQVDEDPRRIGEALVGKHYKGHWKYRIGDYRLVVRFQDAVLVVTVVQVGHRSKVYR